MALRDDLKTWIAKKIWQVIDTEKGDFVTSDRWDEIFNLLIQQGDDTSQKLRDTLDMLYETILDETEGAEHLMLDGESITHYIDQKTYSGWTVDLGTITLYVGPDEPENPQLNHIWIDTTQEM